MAAALSGEAELWIVWVQGVAVITGADLPVHVAAAAAVLVEDAGGGIRGVGDVAGVAVTRAVMQVAVAGALLREHRVGVRAKDKEAEHGHQGADMAGGHGGAGGEGAVPFVVVVAQLARGGRVPPANRLFPAVVVRVMRCGAAARGGVQARHAACRMR